MLVKSGFGQQKYGFKHGIRCVGSTDICLF